MQILGVSQNEARGHIPLKGLDAVKDALRLFAQGRTSGSRATQDRLARDGGGLMLAMKGMAEVGHDGQFLTELFTSIDDGIKRNGRYSRSYDYDGVGSFFKASVDVARLKGSKDMFLLSLSAAYVGDQVEVGVAEQLEIERGLWRIGVKVDVSAESDHFAIDFDAITSRLDGLGFAALTGEQVVQMMMAETQMGYDGKPGVVLFANAEYRVFMGVGSYTVASHWDRESQQVVWSGEGSVLSGPLYNKNEYTDKPLEWATPAVVFEVAPIIDEKERWTSQPIVDEAAKQVLRDVAAKLENAFK